MPEEEQDETGVFKQITPEDDEPKKDDGHDPYNSIPEPKQSD